GLAQVGRVGKGNRALVAHPKQSGTGIQAAGKCDADLLADRNVFKYGSHCVRQNLNVKFYYVRENFSCARAACKACGVSTSMKMPPLATGTAITASPRFFNTVRAPSSPRRGSSNDTDDGAQSTGL